MVKITEIDCGAFSARKANDGMAIYFYGIFLFHACSSKDLLDCIDEFQELAAGIAAHSLLPEAEDEHASD